MTVRQLMIAHPTSEQFLINLPFASDEFDTVNYNCLAAGLNTDEWITFFKNVWWQDKYYELITDKLAVAAGIDTSKVYEYDELLDNEDWHVIWANFMFGLVQSRRVKLALCKMTVEQRDVLFGIAIAIDIDESEELTDKFRAFAKQDLVVCDEWDVINWVLFLRWFENISYCSDCGSNVKSANCICGY